jgi:prepilin-type N-terminal cleavage/methylation domain-containing protein
MRENSKIKRGQRGFSLYEMLLVVAIGFIIAGLSIMTYLRMQRNLRSQGDARDITGDVSLAKMRAAAYFSKARVYADLTGLTFRIEVWNKTTNAWTTEGATVALSKNVTYGVGTVSSPPPNTQATLAQAPLCRDNSGGTIANTACIVFNSRGIPVDSNGAPVATGAFYVTDGGSVYGVTVIATGLIQTWRTDSNAASWKKR